METVNSMKEETHLEFLILKLRSSFVEMNISMKLYVTLLFKLMNGS